ncbi:conserved hypothetical protein [Methanohalobium evestigatum Z-7303]|uniref:Uncharacterized protein n=1 Tax=Methanohalobium evestigatum (strain ATCC BAA-1072 / DSM 3721 / NBRC 107634 / OCM 161 / Z-7303) TaxID=644295 RepID=D7E7N0_METEZ|nr:hypothetical protein [Methanohalobium evestigatum]ADI74103.1 conserved hypothetical protein [Methanohalobium evestigatum Z-7303]
MMEIKNGKRYNTETATELAEYKNMGDTSNVFYMRETLYKTPKGNYFIVGFGRGMSKYGIRPGPGPGCIEDTKLIPLTQAEAFAWCEKTGNYDVIEKEFNDVLEDA